MSGFPYSSKTPDGYYIICMRCGKQCHDHEATLDGYIKGLRVCKKCYDPFPPAEIPVRPRQDMLPVPYPSPVPQPIWVGLASGLTWEQIQTNWEDIDTTWEALG